MKDEVCKTCGVSRTLWEKLFQNVWRKLKAQRAEIEALNRKLGEAEETVLIHENTIIDLQERLALLESMQ